MLHTLPGKRFFSLPVVVKNEAQTDIVILPRSVIAEMHAVQQVVNKPLTSDNGEMKGRPGSSQITVDFGNSPLPPEWKERISALLNSMPEVFALTDMDYGHTDKVKHRIKMSDETPFKHRARPIHPRDIEAVREHLQELLAAGIIRESESPFAFPHRSRPEKRQLSAAMY